jgi:hypothetical protein
VTKSSRLSSSLQPVPPQAAAPPEPPIFRNMRSQFIILRPYRVADPAQYGKSVRPPDARRAEANQMTGGVCREQA